jgi:hypothetical protein
MPTKLRLLANGKWYKFGNGKPIEATQEEISIWETAIDENFSKKTSGESNIIEIAKISSIPITVITFLVLLSDWSTVFTTYKELGITDVTSVIFASNPLHLSGIIYILVGFFSMALFLLVAYLVYSIFSFIAFKIHQNSNVSMLTIMSLVTLTTCAAFWNGTQITLQDKTTPKELQSLILYIGSIPIATTIWLFVNEYTKGKLRLILEVIIVMTTFFLIFTGLIIKFPADQGEEAAKSILRGDATYPPIMIITNQPIYISNQSTSRKIDENTWSYGAMVVDNPKTGKSFYSLQYLAADINNYYLLDVGIGTVHAIPKSSVKQILFISLSSDAVQMPNTQLLMPEPTATIPSP